MNRYLPNQRTRLIVLIIYISIFFIANYFAFGKILPESDSSGLWFYTGLASIILGNYLVTPLYIKPVDAISYSVAAVTALYLVNEWTQWLLLEKIIFVFVLTFLILIIISSFISILLKDHQNIKFQNISNSSRILADVFGSQKIVFSSVILFSLVTFHRQEPKQFFFIALAWIIVTIINPERLFFELFFRIKKFWTNKEPPQVIGNVIAYQNPNIILIRQSITNNIGFGTPLLINDPFSPPKLSLALDYVGRDEALLLRCLEITSSQETKKVTRELSNFLPPNSVAQISEEVLTNRDDSTILQNLHDFIGIVTKDTSIDTLFFEIITKKAIEEGGLVEVEINGKPVIYQLINGFTEEEIVHKKNKFGYIRAKAKKIGMWNEIEKKFNPVKWLPELNSPVMTKAASIYTPRTNSVGHFPSTNYSVDIKNINKAVTHNTAILGILGIGKSMLTIEYIERMLSNGIKVICLDLTSQYELELLDFYNPSIEHNRIEIIQQAGDRDRTIFANNPEEGGSLPNLRLAIHEALKSFLRKDNREFLKIYNPAQLTGTKQISDPRSYQENGTWLRSASLWSITPVTRLKKAEL